VQPNQIMQAAVYPMGMGSLLPNPFLYTLPEVLWNKVKEFFVYSAQFVGPTALGASATQTVQTVVQNDSAFVLLAITGICTSTDESTLVTFVPELLQIQDQTAGRNIFDQSQHYMNVVGTAGEPAFLTLPKLVKPGATLTTTLQNLEATARHVRLSYVGFKVFNQVISD